MKKRSVIFSVTFALMASTAMSQTTRDEVVQMLADQGFTRIEIKKSLFGNLKFEASGNGEEREIVLQKDGTIVRDRTEKDDDHDDRDDDDEDDRDDDDDDQDVDDDDRDDDDDEDEDDDDDDDDDNDDDDRDDDDDDDDDDDRDDD